MLQVLLLTVVSALEMHGKILCAIKREKQTPFLAALMQDSTGGKRKDATDKRFGAVISFFCSDAFPFPRY